MNAIQFREKVNAKNSFMANKLKGDFKALTGMSVPEFVDSELEKALEESNSIDAIESVCVHSLGGESIASVRYYELHTILIIEEFQRRGFKAKAKHSWSDCDYYYDIIVTWD